MSSVFSLMKRDKIKWILFLTGTFIFSTCFSFVPVVRTGFFYYVLSIIRDIPLFVFGLSVYWITQVPVKRSNLMPWAFWVFVIIALSILEMFTFQKMIAWYLDISSINGAAIMVFSAGISFAYGILVGCTMFPLLFSVKRHSPIGDGYVQSIIQKQITLKGLLWIIVLEVVYNAILFGIASLPVESMIRMCIFKLFHLVRYIGMGFILYWVNEKIVADAK